MSSLWLIIKIILFILLLLVIVVSCLLFIVCIAPIRYHILFEKYEEIVYHFRISFLRWISVDVVFEEGVQHVRIKVFGYSFSPKYSKTHPKESHESHENHESHERIDRYAKEAEPVQSDVKAIKTRKHPRTHFTAIGKKLLDQRFWSLTGNILKVFKKLLHCIKPYDLYFDIVIGRDNPADTGELIAQLALLYPWYYRYGMIQGNYEEAGFWGELKARGKFRLITVVKIISFLVVNQETRNYLILLLKSGGED